MPLVPAVSYWHRCCIRSRVEEHPERQTRRATTCPALPGPSSLFTLLLVAGTFACSQPPPPPDDGVDSEAVTGEAERAASSVEGYAKERQQEFVATVESELETLKTRLREIEPRARKAQGETLAELFRHVGRLEQLHQTVSEELGRLRNAPPTDWGKVRQRISGYFEHIDSQYQAAQALLEDVPAAEGRFPESPSSSSSR